MSKRVVTSKRKSRKERRGLVWDALASVVKKGTSEAKSDDYRHHVMGWSKVRSPVNVPPSRQGVVEKIPRLQHTIVESPRTRFLDDVKAVTAEIEAMLDSKNAAYGDSALSPLRVFSKAEADEALRVRIDDKLARLKNGTKDDEDTVLDLIGYLVLLRIARRRRTTT